VKVLLRLNHLGDAHYVEPYAGGASVALALLVGEYVAHTYLNDLDHSVYAFWYSVLNETEALCRLIRNARLSVVEWRRQRAVQQRAREVGLLELGFSTFYLNRVNRSGIICSGGVIGGLDQTGKWKLDARFNSKELVKRIETIADFRDRITLYNRDAARLLASLLPRLPAKALLYLDPPYYVKGKRRLYANFYEHADHVRIAALLAGTKHRWLVSYDDVPEVRALYGEYRHISYRLAYAAAERYEGAEIIFVSQGLTLPSIPNPLKVAEPLRRASEKWGAGTPSSVYGMSLLEAKTEIPMKKTPPPRRPL
jgi:DNA adenine methylase